MSESNFSLEAQVQDLSQKLKIIIRQRKLSYIFLSGIVHSLGSVFGTVVVLGIVGLILSRALVTINFPQVVSDWFNRIIEQSLPESSSQPASFSQENPDELSTKPLLNNGQE